jgi:hypothetical protein
MKRILLIVSLFFSGLGITFAQDQPGDEGNKQQKIQALYIAYISKELKLTADEAQKFWPVHTEFYSEIRAVNPALPELEKKQASLNIAKRYQERFSKILGNNRSNDFFRIDEGFRVQLVERLHKLRQQNNPNNPRRPMMRRNQ